MNWVTIRAALHAFVVSCTGLSPQKVTWARQRNTPRPEQDGIIMKIYVVDDTGNSYLTTENVPLVIPSKSITAVSGDNLTVTAHTLVTGDGPIQLTGADLPAPLAEDTNYWVIRVDADTIRLAIQFEDTGGGDATGNTITPITLTNAGSGVMTLAGTADTLRAGEEINFVQSGLTRATLQLFSYVADDTGMDGAVATLRKVANRYKLPSNRDILDGANVSVTSMERTRSMLGSQDATLFEPRAWIDIYLSLAFEEREAGTIISRVKVENLTTGEVLTIPPMVDSSLADSWSSGFSNGFGG